MFFFKFLFAVKADLVTAFRDNLLLVSGKRRYRSDVYSAHNCHADVDSGVYGGLIATGLMMR